MFVDPAKFKCYRINQKNVGADLTNWYLTTDIESDAAKSEIVMVSRHYKTLVHCESEEEYEIIGSPTSGLEIKKASWLPHLPDDSIFVVTKRKFCNILIWGSDEN